MIKKIFSAILIASTVLISCEDKMSEEEITEIGIKTCRKPADFVKSLGFDVTRSAFSTDDQKTKGLQLIQMPLNVNDTSGIKKYQHPTWSQYGYMGSIATDDDGNAYVCPIPVINTFDNPLHKINSLYKVDHSTGEMKLFCSLPKIDSVEGVVPFGPLGVYFDCHASKIYVASVGGSTRDEEKGSIYVINKTTGKIEDDLKNIDAMGLCVGGVTGTKKLYFGSARNPDIYTIALNKEGHFKGKPTKELTLDQLGPRGDDKARRIRFDKNGNLLIYGVEFNFSLAAQTQKPETAYLFSYYQADEKWALIETK